MKFRKKEKSVFIDTYDKRKKSGIFSRIHFPDLSENPKIQFMNKYSLLFHGILACILVFVIEWVSRHSFTSTISFLVSAPLTFLYNALLIFTTLLIVYLVKRRALLRMIISVFWLLLGIVNGCVLASRVTPFNFTDLKLVGDLLNMKNSKYFTMGQEILVIISLAVLCVFLVFLAIKGPKFQGRVHRMRNLACVALCILSLPFITKAAIQSDILSGYFGNLAQGYKDYGFVYSFSASVVDTGMGKPESYSEEAVDEINKNVKTPATSVDKKDLPNIIFIQLETFIDPYELKFLNYSKDPIPNFRKLMKNYTSGHLTVPVVGAGTANTEFEVLTGMGIRFFGLGEYPYKTVLKTTSCESAANVLSEIGYGTHALHNNGGNFYGRANVFSQMGFDTFTSKELMNITKYNEIGSWPTDDILLEETLKTLDSTKDQSDFLYTITVQSHGSYPDYQVFENPEIQVTGGETEGENYQWEYYINQLHEVDRFIGNLIDALSKRDEKTIVVMYGDHLPTMGLEDDDMAQGNLYDTTYATWNNFGLEKQDKDVAAYQLMSYITGQLGIHEGTLFKYHQSAMAAKTTEEDSYISNWEMLQYDLLYGNKYTYDENDKYPASDLVMGVQDVVLNKTEISDDESTLILTGKNFTPWSKVFVNDTKVSTEYVSDTCLHVALSDVPDDAVLAVNQMGSSNTIFRSSNSLTYHAPEDLRNVTLPHADIPDTKEEDLSAGNVISLPQTSDTK